MQSIKILFQHVIYKTIINEVFHILFYHTDCEKLDVYVTRTVVPHQTSYISGAPTTTCV